MNAAEATSFVTPSQVPPGFRTAFVCFAWLSVLVLWTAFFTGGRAISVVQVFLFASLSLAVVHAVSRISRNFFFPYIFLGLYVCGYVLSFANILRDIHSQDRSGFLTIGTFDFSVPEVNGVLLVILAGLAGFLSAVVLAERLSGRAKARSLPAEAAPGDGRLRRLAGLWAALSVLIAVLMWQLNLGRHGLVTPLENQLPWRLEGGLLYLRDYLVCFFGFALCDKVLGLNDKKLFLPIAALLLGISLLISFVSLSRIQILFPAVVMAVCVGMNYKKLGLNPKKAILLAVTGFFLLPFAVSLLTEVRNLLYVGHFVNRVSMELGFIAQPLVFFKLLLVRVEGIRQLLAVTSTATGDIHSFLSAFSGSEAAAGEVMRSVYGFVPHNKPGQAFGLTYGVWGLLYLAKNHALVFAGTFVYAAAGMLSEYFFARKGFKTVSFYVALSLAMIIWMNLTMFFAVRFFMTFLAGYFLLSGFIWSDIRGPWTQKR